MAKRMILVEEREYNEKWKQTPIETSKSHLSNKLRSRLASSDVPDDVKAKLYQQTLKRFLNLKEEVSDLPPSTLNGLHVETKPRKTKIAQRQPKIVHWEYIPRRKRVKWSKYNDE
jgi:hypothetical protein